MATEVPPPPVLERQAAEEVPAPPPPAKEKKEETAPPKEKKEETAPVEEPPKKKRKSKSKKYVVGVPHGDTNLHNLVHVNKSGPKSAVSQGVRQMIKSVPLKQPTTVWVSSGSHYHEFEVHRDYDNPKHKRFKVLKKNRSVTKKQAKSMPDLPDWLKQ
jgi:hypothetical protein